MKLFNPDEGEFKKIVKPNIPMSKKEAVAMLECSWNRITEDLIIDAWNEAIKNISINTSIREIDICRWRFSGTIEDKASWSTHWVY